MKGKVVIVTGASSGIGRATAIEFARKGAQVVLAARSDNELEVVKAEIEKLGGTCLSVKTDVSLEESCKNMIEKTIETYGQIDVLVNNAGISIRAILEDMQLDTFKKVMDVNLYGAVYCTKYALPYLLKTKGSVVGVSSIAGYVGLPARTAYCASKSGLQGFLESLRIENRKTGLHVLVACPGYTESNIRKKALNAVGESQDESPINEGNIMPASAVARKLVRAVIKRKRRLTLTTEGILAVHIAKFFPGFIETQIFKRVTSEPGSPIRLK